MSIRPFAINIPDERIEDLRSRLRAARWPKPVDGVGWNDGTDLHFLQRLTDYWLNRFDWRAQEKRLNSFPQFLATVEDQEIHFVHMRGSGPAPLPLILSHGWPGSFAEMEKVIPLLADREVTRQMPFTLLCPRCPATVSRPVPLLRASVRSASLISGEA